MGRDSCQFTPGYSQFRWRCPDKSYIDAKAKIHIQSPSPANLPGCAPHPKKDIQESHMFPLIRLQHVSNPIHDDPQRELGSGRPIHCHDY